MKNRQIMTNGSLRYGFLLLAGLFLAFLIQGCGNDAANAATGEDEAAAAMAATEEAAMDPVAEGREWYLSYCTMCHGEDAKGDGAMAEDLTMPPPDLTMIAQRRGGNFPADEISNIIADASEVPGHSTGDMPAWWETFQSSEGISDAKELETKIEHITAYLETIQVK